MVRIGLSLSLLLGAAASSTLAVNTSALNGWYACNDLTFSDEGSVSDSMGAECAIYNAPLCHTGICDDSSDQTISVFFKRILASTNASTAPNVWFLQGGPGASSTAMEDGMIGLYSILEGAVNVYTMDHRGTGRSHLLQCVASQVETTGSPDGTSISDDEVPECAQELETTYGDLASFSVTSAATDLSTFISTFTAGETTYVYGVSYGTALVERLIHLDTPEVDGYILDGIATSSGVTDLTKFEYFSTWDRDFGEVGEYYLSFCAEDATCNAAFSETNVSATIKNLFADFDANPNSTCAAIVRDITSGVPGVAVEPASYTVREQFGSLLMAASTRKLIPVLTHRMSRCNEEDAKVVSFFFTNVNSVMSSASQDDAFESNLLYNLIVFSEMWETPEVSYEVMLERFTGASTASGSEYSVSSYCAYSKENSTSCAETNVSSYSASPILYAKDAYWNVAAEIPSHASVLLMNGKMDPQTPYKYATYLYEVLNGTAKELVTFDYATHGTVWSTPVESSNYTCGMQILASYVTNAGDLSLLDKSCVSEANVLSFNVSASINRLLLSASEAYDGDFVQSSSSSSSSGSASTSSSTTNYKTEFIVFIVLFAVVLVLAVVFIFRYVQMKKRNGVEVPTPVQVAEPVAVSKNVSTPKDGGTYESHV